MVYLRLSVALACLGLVSICHAQLTHVPEATPAQVSLLAAGEAVADFSRESFSADLSGTLDLIPAQDVSPTSQSAQEANLGDPHPRPSPTGPLDNNGDPIPLNRLQPQRILGFMPNFRSVSEGAKPHPPAWKYNFTIATRQSTDYSSFVFLGITSLSAEGINEHPVLGKGIPGMWAYSWRGFLDKTDNTYLSAWFLPSLIHEDTRFYALGAGHPIPIRALYVISRQGVARTYGGRQTPNIAGLGGKVLTQLVSRNYYPTGATSFSVLAVKFGYSAMRDVAITSIREFYPDAAAHFIRKHREKMARLAAENDASIQ
jgi:hypothetical protein